MTSFSGWGRARTLLVSAASISVALAGVVNAFALPVLFTTADALTESINVTVAPAAPLSTTTLQPNDPARPSLWYSPCATQSTNEGVAVWYQRVDKDETAFIDQRSLCLGVLRDGTWQLPDFGGGPPTWGGPNNVVLRRSEYEGSWGGFNQFQVVRYGGGYSLLYWDQPAEGPSGLMLATSVDGVRWKKESGTLFTELTDTFTVTQRGSEYYLYQTVLEEWPEKPYQDNLPNQRRLIAVRTSTDLRTWSAPSIVMRPSAEDPLGTEFYAFRSFAYGDGYAAILLKYEADPATPGVLGTRLQSELALSQDGVTWQRPNLKLVWPFWTAADPVRIDDRLVFITGQAGRLERVDFQSLRLTGVSSREEGGFMTAPFDLPGVDIALDADANAGWIDVEVYDADGAPLGGYTPCRVAGVEGVALPLLWDGFASTQLPLSRCRLHIRMNNATLYAVTAASG